MKRQEIVDYARTYLGTPWRHRGRTRTGVDCIGLICVTADHFEVAYEDIDGYSRNPDGRFVEHILKFMEPRKPSEIKPGSAVILRDAHQPCHIGWITERYGQLYLLHASLQKRKVYEEEWEGLWKSRLRCVVELPGTED